MPDARTALPFARLASLGAALLTFFAASAGAQQSKPSRPAASGSHPERQIICRGAAVPNGWLLVDNLKDRDMCSGSNDAAYNSYNVWAIERFDNRPAGSEMDVCAAVPTPAGWTVVDVYRAVNRCGHPSDPFVVNVKRIRKRD